MSGPQIIWPSISLLLHPPLYTEKFKTKDVIPVYHLISALFNLSTGEHVGKITVELIGRGSGEHVGQNTGGHVGQVAGEHVGQVIGEHVDQGTGEHVGKITVELIV